MPTKKKIQIPAMMPVKKWLSLPEACAYMDMNIDTLAVQNLTTSAIGKKTYYLVTELDDLIENAIIKRKIK